MTACSINICGRSASSEALLLTVVALPADVLFSVASFASCATTVQSSDPILEVWNTSAVNDDMARLLRVERFKLESVG